MTKIVYIGIGTLTPLLYEALCIDVFVENKVDVIYVDITELLFGYKAPKSQYCINVVEINSYCELEKFIQSNAYDGVLYNIQIYYENRFWRLFYLLKKYKCRLSMFAIGYGPNVFSKHKLVGYIKSPIHLIQRTISKLLKLIVIILRLIPTHYDIVFTAGEVAKSNFKNTSRCIVEINFIDYEKYSCSIHAKSEDSIVFLDCYMANHEDIGFSTNALSLNAEKYFEQVNSLFDHLERIFHKSVVIAAHPKSNYPSNTFYERMCLKDQTLNLLHQSLFVLSHHSTAVSYAVLLSKPIVFFYTNEMEKLYKSSHIPFMHQLAKVLGMPCINIEQEDIQAIPKIDKDMYNNYKYNYLTSKMSENLTNKEIIKRFLQSDAEVL